jgi:hypothetical protein
MEFLYLNERDSKVSNWIGGPEVSAAVLEREIV